jgi:pentatricopeptide repeat protein
MERDGCTPDAITYSTIVKAYCITGELDKALKVFRDMQGNCMAKDCIVYNTMLDGCTRHNRMDLADMVLDDMDKYNIRASNFTLGILVKMYGRRHQLDKAFEVVRTLPEKHGITVNAQVNTSLICSCINGGNLDLGFKVFNDWKLAGNTIDAKAYSVLISGCVRHGHVQRAIPLVEEACDRITIGDANLLENETLEQLFRALSQQGQTQTVAVPLMEKLRAAGVPMNGRLVSSLHSKSDVGRQRPGERAQNRQPRH